MAGLLKLTTLTICLALTLGVWQPPCFARQSADVLLERKIALHLTDATLLQALSKLAAEKRVPIGFELGETKLFERRLNVAVEDAKLRDVLDMVMRQEPGYRWEVRDGVVNILPAARRDPFIEKFLNTPVRRFAPAKGLGKFGLKAAVIDLPEVRKTLKQGGVTALLQGSYYYPSIYSNEKADLSLSDTDVKGVLNKIVSASEHKMWVIVREGDSLQYLQLGL